MAVGETRNQPSSRACRSDCEFFVVARAQPYTILLAAETEERHEELHAYDMPNRIEIGILFDILKNFDFSSWGL